ncbi:MAG TPA: HWE histidine kinase domain-containing protein [Caulobacter sp.]|nr:HWE histidine kinase domain-containing protein [Caulobacter sp.]
MPLESFASVAEDAPAMLWRGDAEGRCVYLNRALRDFWGVEDVAAFSWASTLLPEDGEAVFGPFSQAMATRTGFRCEGRYRRADGAVRVLETVATPRFENGVFVGMVGVNTDVTDQRLAQAALEESEARQRLLLAEMTHRVKNTLATVLSISSQTARASASIEAYRQAFEARITALARTHDLLTGGAAEQADLRQVLQAELSPYAGSGGRLLTMEGEPVRLDAAVAVDLALVVHEMATNAAKYGAYSVDGALEVTWRLADSGLVEVNWRESGVVIAPPDRTGFGVRLITRLLRAHGGDLESEFREDGLAASLRFRPTQSGARL